MVSGIIRIARVSSRIIAGYETSRALETYTSGTPVQVLLGQGFGKQLDLDLFIALGWGDTGERERIHFAPILHNGYAYLLFKAGPISLVMVAYALAWLYVTGRRKAGGGPNQPLRAPGRILQAVALSLAFYTWVYHGSFRRRSVHARSRVSAGRLEPFLGKSHAFMKHVLVVHHDADFTLGALPGPELGDRLPAHD